MILRSPIFPHKNLEKQKILDKLEAYVCPTSNGIYIPAEHYYRWLHSIDDDLTNILNTDTHCKISKDLKQAKLCPETGTIMLRYEVGHGFKFCIERSITGGIWLDQGEWDALQQRNFHNEIHLIFSEPWQKRVRDQQFSDTYISQLKERLGIKLFEEVHSLKETLATHEERNAALAYLMNE